MDPCPFIRILVGNLSLKFPVASKPSRSEIHPLSSPCFCKIKLHNFPHQFASLPLSPIENRTSAACFNLNSHEINRFSEKRFLSNNSIPCLKVEVYTGSSSGSSCGLSNRKFLGRVLVPIDLKKIESKGFVYHNGWVSIGGNGEGSSAELFLNVRGEFDPRFVFQFDGEPECSPQVFQIQGNVRQAVFTCKFSFRNSGDRNLTSRTSMSEPSTSRNWLPCSKTDQHHQSKERKGWSITIHDLSGSPVAMASMVTPFVPSQNSDRVSRSNPGAWLILRPGNNTWKPWGRLEAWRERSGSDSLGYRFELLPEATTSTTETTTLASSTISTKNGGKFTIDITNSITPVSSPHSSIDFGSGSTSRPGSGSGSDFGFGGFLPYFMYKGFVMSSTVGKSSKPEVEIGVQHVTCTEDAAVFVALAAAMDLSMDACRLFSHKLRKELRQE